MRYETELMRSILTDEMAQEIIDYVAPIYGNSYVGLWLYQAIGKVLGRVSSMAEQMRYETNAVTSEILLDYWEDHYGIPRNPTLSTEQRRARLASKTQSRGPINPKVLANAVSAAIGGVPVDIEENVAKNTFLVNIREVIPSLVPVVAVLERMAPAHLVYQIRVATQTVAEADIKIAVAMTHAEIFKTEVLQ